MHDSQLHHELAARGVSDLHAAGHFLHFNAKGRRMRRRTLILLNERGPLPQKEVQDILQIKSGSISEMLGKMEKEGLLERVRDEHDRRSTLLQITPEGQKEAAKLQTLYEARMSRMMDCFSEDELLTLCESLEKMQRHWLALEETGFFEIPGEEETHT